MGRLKLLENKPLTEAQAQALLNTGVVIAFEELRRRTSKVVTDYRLRQMYEARGAPTMRLSGGTRKRREDKPKPLPAHDNTSLARAAFWIGWGLGLTGLAMNAYYSFTLGGTPWEKGLTIAINVLIDSVSIFGLAWACAPGMPVYHRISAVIIWLLAVFYSFQIGTGFMTTVLGDHLRLGAKVDQYQVDLTAQIDRDTARLTTLNARDINAEIQIEQALIPRRKWDSSHGCIDDTNSSDVCDRLKQLRKDRDDKTALPATLAQLTAKRFEMPAIGKDTTSEQVESVVHISRDRIDLYRNVAPAGFLALAGLLMSYHKALLLMRP